MKAIESKFLDIPWQRRQDMFLEAYTFKPHNMDALHALAQDHFDSGRFHIAYIYALRAVSIKQPETLQTVENILLRPTKYLYDYEGFRLLGFAAREIMEWEVRPDTEQRTVEREQGCVIPCLSLTLLAVLFRSVLFVFCVVLCV